MVETGMELTGFHKLSCEGRLEIIKKYSNIDEGDLEILQNALTLARNTEVDWLENQVSAYILPLSIAPYFIVNGKQYLVPLVTEEAGIVAACSFAAKSAAKNGGFVARMIQDYVTGQVVCYSSLAPHNLAEKIQSVKADLIEQVNRKHQNLKEAGGGLRDISARIVKAGDSSEYLSLDIIVDSKDAMGAALVTTMAEEVASLVQRLFDCNVLLRVISNDMRGRLCECEALFDTADLDGLDVGERIVRASDYAFVDPHRAITHNKGIMNGMVAFTTALGNDTRAMEAAAHFFASSSGTYLPLSTWTLRDGQLKGVLRVPAALGSVGGSIKASRISRLCYKILGVDSGVIVREICMAVGLAANLGVLRALVTTGIGKSHHQRK